MTAKEYMEQVRRAEEELVLIARKRSHYIDLMLSMGVKSGPVVKSSGGTSRTEAAGIGLVDLMADAEDKIKEYTTLVQEAEKLIAQIPQERFRQILTYKYLCGLPPKEIQKEMEFKDEKSVYRCNGYALQELQKVRDQNEGKDHRSAGGMQ